MFRSTTTLDRTHGRKGIRGRISRGTLLGALGLLAVTAGYTPQALAAGSTTVTAFPPGKAGTVTIRLFVCADAQCRHGVPCDVNVNVPANITAEQKAALIQAAINRAPCGVETRRVGNQVFITSRDGVRCTFARDDTNEIMLVDNDEEGVPVEYTTTVNFLGETTGGDVEFGENDSRAAAPTGGRSIKEILEDFRRQFGEGEVTDRGLELPPRFGDYHGFFFNVTDPGLTIEVYQEVKSEPAPTPCDQIKSMTTKCKRGKLKVVIKSDLPEGTELEIELLNVESQSVKVNKKGKAKAKWTDRNNRAYAVCIKGCDDWCQVVECE